MTIKPCRSYAYSAFAIAGLIVSLACTAQASSADPTNLIDNPGFTSTNGVMSPVQVNVASGPTFSTGATIDPWTVSGLVFLFGANSSSPSGTNADFGSGAANHFAPSPPPGFCLWGPGACGGSVANGLTIGPSGGNFVALDGEDMEPGGIHVRGEISQMITGLEVGVPTTVEFDWAVAQQAHFPGATTEQLQVSLCPASGCTPEDIMLSPIVHNPHMGFQPWRSQEFTFIPTTTSEVLSFLSIGTPALGNLPPFALIDGGVSLTEHTVPEPGAWSLLVIGLAAMAGIAYRRAKWLGERT
jgi:hypothetical protein